MSGWIKLHRSLRDHFLFDFNEPDKALAWIDLLMSASFSDHKVHIKGRVLDVKRGQFCVSQVTLQKRWGMSQNKVKRFLNLLKTEGMVDVQTNDATTIITICNYEDYQDIDSSDERANERAGERTANEPRTTIKERKEDKEIISTTDVVDKTPRKTKKTDLDFSKWPEQPEQQTMADWLAMRKRIKADVTQTVINRLTTELTKAVSAGYTVDQCISECCLRNWRGFQLDWIRNAGVKPYGNQTHHNTSHAGRYENPTARLLRMAREYEPAADTGNIIEADFKAH